jgi:hypothetical protein
MNLLRRLLRFLSEQDETYYDTGRSWADNHDGEPYSRRQIDTMAAEQGVRFPRSHGPHTVG